MKIIENTRHQEASVNQKMIDIASSLNRLGYKQVNNGYVYTFVLRGGFTLDMDTDALWINKESAGFHMAINWKDVSLGTTDIRNGGKMSIGIGRNGTSVDFY